MKKYDYDNNEMSTASEPAWTYGSSAMQMPMTEGIEDNFELSPEIKQMLDERVKKIENGTAVLKPWEGTIAEARQRLARLKQERLAYANL
jgi:hypothetical protein